MSGFIKNMKISNAVLLVSIIPIIIAIIFSGALIYKDFKHVESLNKLETLTTLSVKMSALVHEQQKERGATAVFVGSKGTKFSSELRSQRKDTDKKYSDLNKYIDTFNAKSFDSTFNKKFNAILKKLDKLSSIRNSVDSLSISKSKAIGYYTGLNGQNLDLIGYMAELSPEPKIVTSIIGYTNFMQGKERAGIERAVGAGGFSSDEFKTAALDKFKSLIGAQNVYSSIFLAYARPSQKDIYEKVMNSDAAKDVDRMRNIAINSNGYKSMGIDGSYWFKSITKKINGLKEIEDELAQDLVEEMVVVKSLASNTMWLTIILAGVFISLTIIISIAIVKSVNSSFLAVVSSINQLSTGNLDAHLPEQTDNEIGDIVKGLIVFQRNGKQNEVMAMEQREENQIKIRRSERVEQLINNFDSKANNLLSDLSDAANNMEIISQSMSAIAEETTKQATAVATAAVESGTSVNGVASATEELAASISSISDHVVRSSENTKSASVSVEQARAIMSRLSESADKIGQVVNLITDIAEQTNLLALNATIESARAGDAGKGFAVVANEVKSLASETQKATDEITIVIQSVQAETKEAVQSIEDVSNVIDGLTEIATSISNAIDEQSAATREISGNVQEVSSGSNEVSSNIEGVSQAAAESGVIANDVLGVASKLKGQSNNMKEEIETFLKEIRTA